MKLHGVILAAACVTSGLLATGRAEAQNIYLEIPGVQGEVVTPAAFAGQIEVLSVSLGASKPACGPGSISLSDVALMKNTDKSSVDLSIALRDHTVYPSIYLRFAHANDFQVFQVYQLNNAVVTSLQMSGSSGGAGRTTESVTFSFSQMIVTYTFIDSNGKAASPESMTFTASACP